MKILGVGIATLDIINDVDIYPQENTEIRAESQNTCRGGNVTNTLSVLSQFQNQCSWVGVLCRDNNAQVIVDDLTQNNIDFSRCHRLSAGITPVSYILRSRKTGSRSIVHFRDMPELTFAHFKKLELKNFDWIHFEGRAIEQTYQMLKWCKINYPHISTSVEIEKNREQLDNILNLADVYLYAKAYAVANGFDDAATFLKKEGLKSPSAALICTWSESGAYALIDGSLIYSPALDIEHVVDTLGAGDTFNAGIIQARLKNLNWRSSLDFANRLAGIKCGQLGFAGLTGNI